MVKEGCAAGAMPAPWTHQSPFLRLHDTRISEREIAVSSNSRRWVMGKQKQRPAQDKVQSTPPEYFSTNKAESIQSSSRSNDQNALDEIVEVYRQHSHL
mgnify:CR=1 FL=1